MTACVVDGAGVAVTPCTNEVSVPPSVLATTPRPPAPMYRTNSPTITTPTPSATWPTRGMPRLRRTGPWTAIRPGAGALGRVLTGVERPPDGGRGLT